jgi:hypothetical protein
MLSHKRLSLSAIVSTRVVCNQLSDETPSCCAETIDESTWWQSRCASVRLRRTITDYLKCLELVLRNSNSLMFIDAHLDPSRDNYAEFGRLLEGIRHQKPTPKIELHCVCYQGSVKNRNFPKIEEFKDRFSKLGPLLRPIQAEVFVWDDFHDRYLISNLMGISLPNGFDTSKDANQKTTWTALSPQDRDDIQREFDPALKRHYLHHRFPIAK